MECLQFFSILYGSIHIGAQNVEHIRAAFMVCIFGYCRQTDGEF